MEDSLNINEKYAAKYNEWRAKEELQKFKDRHGDIENEEDLDSSSSETEDEDGELLTPKLEKNWLCALAAVKCKNPKIYKEGTHFFTEPESDQSGKESSKSKKQDPSQKKNKPMFLKDYEREVILKKGGVIESDNSENEWEVAKKENELLGSKPGYFEEQQQIKKSFQLALSESDSDSEELLTKRVKSTEEEAKEEAEHLEWLKGQKEELTEDKEIGIELNPLKEYWNDPSLDDKEKFLRDYILNKRYKEDDDESIPTYDEVVNHCPEQFSEDEDILEKQEHFERKYNFRFEEPDEEFIKSFPRTIGESLRKKDNKRAKKREEVKERKALEKQKKKEELKQLKNIKRKEIMSKLETLKAITGNPSVGFSEEDFEKDFDPAEYDQMMKEVFNPDFYNEQEDAEGKPIFPDVGDEDDDENWDNWQGDPGEAEAGDEEYFEPHCEDPDFIMDADYDPSQPPPEDRTFGLDGKSKKKKKSKFKQAIAKTKPVFNPDDKTFEEYFDEYYKLDYEDIIADLPCRFKYRKVPSNDFGLTTEEVMSAKEKELNAWVSVKRMSQYKTEEEEQIDMRIYKKKARNQNLKSRILASLAKDDESPAEEEHDDQEPSTSGALTAEAPKENKKRKHEEDSGIPSSERSKAKHPHNLLAGSKQPSDSQISDKGFKKMKLDQQPSVTTTERSPSSLKKKKKKKKKKKHHSIVSTGPSPSLPGAGERTKKKKKSGKRPAMTEERLKAYGIDPKKFKYTHGKIKLPM